MKWGAPFCVLRVPPCWQARASRQSQGLKREKSNEKSEMMPKQARELGFDRRACELETRRTSGCSKRKEQLKERVTNGRQLLQSIRLFVEEEDEESKAAGHQT